MTETLNSILAAERRDDLTRRTAEHHSAGPGPATRAPRRWVSLSDLFGHPSERWGAERKTEPECATC